MIRNLENNQYRCRLYFSSDFVFSVMLSKTMQNHADKKIIIIIRGKGNTIEIWNVKKFKHFSAPPKTTDYYPFSKKKEKIHNPHSLWNLSLHPNNFTTTSKRKTTVTTTVEPTWATNLKKGLAAILLFQRQSFSHPQVVEWFNSFCSATKCYLFSDCALCRLVCLGFK